MNWPIVIGLTAAFTITATAAIAEQIDLQTSVRASAWSSDRLNQSEGGVQSVDLWIRGSSPPSEAVVSARFEAWAGSNPTGSDKPAADVREALVTVDFGAVTLSAGRQLFVWGRADRINPTDVISPHDYRRLVDEDEDNRLGIASVEISLPTSLGKFSGYWLPEFRSTELPQSLARPGLAVRKDQPNSAGSQFALRFERFGESVDGSITYSEVADRIPWLALETQRGRPPTLALKYPRLATLGADLATNVGPYGLRLEAAAYDYDRAELQAFASGNPRFAAVLGVDRSFAGQWSVIAQAVLRVRSREFGPAGPVLAFSARNSVIHGAWRPNIYGGFVRIRKGFSGDRGSLEVAAASLSGGGSFSQIKGGFTLRDAVRMTVLLEHYTGDAASYFGRLRGNNLAMVGLRAGF